jgi:hypothetical protein
MADAMAGAGRQGSELPAAGDRASDGEQYRLQCKRIGRRKGYQGPPMVPGGHRHKIKRIGDRVEWQ